MRLRLGVEGGEASRRRGQLLELLGRRSASGGAWPECRQREALLKAERLQRAGTGGSSCSGGHRGWPVPGLLLLLLRGSWAAESARFVLVDQKASDRRVSTCVAACVGAALPEVTAALGGGSFYCPFLPEALAEVGVERL